MITEVSVGRIAPPPDRTRTRHWPQVPPPPQADGTNRPAVGEALHELAADGNGQFEFVVDDDIDVARRHQLGARGQDDEDEDQDDGREQANAQQYFLQYGRVDVHCYIPEKPMKLSDMRPTMMNAMPSPCRPSGTSEYLSFSRMPASAISAIAQPAPLPTPKTTDSAQVVLALDHEQRAAEDGAVHGDQRQEDAERVVELREEPIERHLENLHQRRDDADVADQSEEAQVDVRQAGPGQRAVGEQVAVKIR